MTTDRKGPVKAVDFPVTTRAMPATQGMLVLVRDELNYRITAAEERITQQFMALQGDVQQLRSELRERVADLRAELTHVMALAEEQRAQNTIVIEATHGMIQRQDRFEAALKELAEEQRTELAKFRAELHRHDQRFDRIEETLRQHGAEIAELRRGQQELRASQQELREGQQELRASQQELREGQQELRAEVRELRQEMSVRFDQILALLQPRRDG